MKFNLDKKTSKKFIAISLISTMLLSNLVGCTKTENIEISNEEILDDSHETIESNDEQSLLIEKLPKGTVNIKDFLDKMTSIEVNYNYSEYYFDDDDYQELLNVMGSKKECTNNCNYSYQEIWGYILNNSNLSSDNEREDEVINALYNALSNLFSNIDNAGDDFCKLKDIIITIDNLEDDVLGQYSDSEKLITIDYDKVKQAYEELENKDSIAFSDYLIRIIQHELNHVRQYICDCREFNGQINETICFKSEEVFESLVEASAESQIYNSNVNESKYIQEDTFMFTYRDERKYQSLILLMGMFKDDFSIDKYYAEIFDSDIEGLFNLFKLETKEDFKDFYNIAYAIDSLNSLSMLSNNLYCNGYTMEGSNNAIGNDYKIAIFKYTCKDLIKKVNQDKLSLGESLKLYNFIKTNILEDEDNLENINDNWVYIYNDDFIDQVDAVDGIFYEFISACFNISMSEIKEIIDDEKFIVSVDYLCNYSSLHSENYDYEIRNINEYLIEKYPIISEISFCNSCYYSNISTFDENFIANCEKEKVLK